MGGQISIPAPVPGSPSTPAAVIVPPKCPAPFVSADALSCVMPCPADKKFVRQTTNGTYTCAYSPDTSITAKLVTVGAVVFNGTTLEQLRAENVAKYTEFSTEKDRFEKELITVYANIDKQKKIDDAFKDLQKAENARDQSPEAYQSARTAYYMLVKGAGWLDEERRRVAAAVVEPEAQKYEAAVSDYKVRTQEQQKTIDIVNGIKDKVLSLKDDFKYSVTTFNDQLEKVKLQIAMENRSRPKDASSQTKTATWINLILNGLLVAVLLYAAYTLAKRFLFSRPPPPAIRIQVPAYRGTYA